MLQTLMFFSLLDKSSLNVTETGQLRKKERKGKLNLLSITSDTAKRTLTSNIPAPKDKQKHLHEAVLKLKPSRLHKPNTSDPTTAK